MSCLCRYIFKMPLRTFDKVHPLFRGNRDFFFLFLTDPVNFAAARRSVPLFLIVWPPFLISKNKETFDFFVISLATFSLFFLRASDIGAPPLLSASLNGLADTDSESAIFSSGLLALFYLRSLVRARLFLPRAFLFSLALLFSFHALIFSLLHSPLPRILSQILTYDYVRANIWISVVGPFKQTAMSFQDIGLQCHINN